MKKIPTPQDVNLPLLTEELFDAFPDWSMPDPLGRDWNVTNVAITAEEILFPDATDEKEVEKVLRKHDKNKDSRNQAKAKERAQKLESAKNKLRGLGLTDEEIEALRK
jgi:hypothetical protein